MSSHFLAFPSLAEGLRRKPIASPFNGGEVVKGLSGASLDYLGGVAPSSFVQDAVRRSRELDYSAQVTPAFQAVLQERKRADLVRRTKRKLRLYQKSQVARVVSAGMGRGLEFKTPISSAWDISGRCLNPREFRMDAAASRLRGERLVRAPGRSYSVVLTVRCRACEWCLRQRAARWAFRAVEEIASAGRTWFATFTFTPHNHVVMRARASRRLAAGGTDLALLSATEQHVELSREYGAELTKYFKRIRKNSGAPLRYILVQEPHKSGLPHFHALIHESDQARPIRHRTLATGWTLGFSKIKLCEGSKTAWYVAKYLTKNAWVRVRASLRYGKTDALTRSKPTATRENMPHQDPNQSIYGVQPLTTERNENDYIELQKGILSNQTEISALSVSEAQSPGSSSSWAFAKATASAIASHAIAALARAYETPYSVKTRADARANYPGSGASVPHAPSRPSAVRL